MDIAVAARGEEAEEGIGGGERGGERGKVGEDAGADVVDEEEEEVGGEEGGRGVGFGVAGGDKTSRHWELEQCSWRLIGDCKIVYCVSNFFESATF